jgi:hypothetical protein
MYLVRRVFKTKPGEARRVATLVHEQVQIYHDAGHREEFRVAYNDRTCPGEQNIVILEWETAAFQSPSRDGNNIPPAAYEAGAAYRPYIEETYIEFMELLTPGKMQE